jgi:hypothetical protein
METFVTLWHHFFHPDLRPRFHAGLVPKKKIVKDYYVGTVKRKKK